MNNNGIELKAQKIYKRELARKVVKISFLFLFLIFAIIYLVLYIVYEGGRFTVTLDKNLLNRKNVYLSESGSKKDKSLKLSAETIQYMDNISIKWLPKDIDNGIGSHNGDNYIAYSFYVVNAGKEKVNYWYEIDIDDTIRNVDEAIRIMIIKNGKETVYAKKSKETDKAEEGTKQFISKSIAVLEQRKSFNPNSKDHYTIVVWIEGDDTECNNDLLGGEIKMHMDITEEHVYEKKTKDKRS